MEDKKTKRIVRKIEKCILKESTNKTADNQLKIKFKALDYQYNTFNGFSELKNILEKKIPTFVIFDKKSFLPEELGWLKLYHQNQPTVFIFYGDINSFEERLYAVRAGCDLYLDRNSESTDIEELIYRYKTIQDQKYYRVMILDNLEHLGKRYANYLESVGMIVKVVAHPASLLESLEAFLPDLILLDLAMSECSGLELAAVLRQSEKYFNLPIIFIADEDNESKQAMALTAASGELLLTKPILSDVLTRAIVTKLKRAAITNAYINRDKLTDLLTHAFLLEMLNKTFLSYQRNKKEFCYAMVDVDYFKKINDTYGHPAGDHVLKKLAHFIASRIRKTDYIGRYGGEEFGIIFTDCTLQDANMVCKKIGEALQHFKIEIEDIELHATVSIGVAGALQASSSRDLLNRADRALYRAKTLGRNRVVVSKSI